MESPSEIMELLREIRESQRELLDMTKAWKAKSDLANEEAKAESAKMYAQWDEANRLWLENNKVASRIDPVILVHRLVVIALLGIIAASVWFK